MRFDRSTRSRRSAEFDHKISQTQLLSKRAHLVSRGILQCFLFTQRHAAIERHLISNGRSDGPDAAAAATAATAVAQAILMAAATLEPSFAIATTEGAEFMEGSIE